MRTALAPARLRMQAMMKPRLSRTAQHSFAGDVARLAARSLHAELCLYPKPGLVSLVDPGSHEDMDAQTFMRSLFSLRHYFKKICLAGLNDAPFARLKQLGIEAEAAMLKATRGINTHRGAIFSLGLLCATAGRARAQGTPMTPAALRAAMLIRWGEELAMHAAAVAAPSDLSNGLRVAARYAVSGAREEGALGLPSVFEIGVPALLASRARGASMTHARIDTLFTLMARISDSNVYHRAGPQGAQTVRTHAQHFIDLGGTANADWCAQALASHQAFVQQRLSPGGAADLLAASCLVHAIAAMEQDEQ
ncbi:MULTISPECIES: triphosphoribosyl-dephospho-CoA synthase MdcB [unclassified Duganella]|uniref:triphosphoribosyl-dephospho-CoA synthase MdcB n=1 Tax=unclassified Duganella TaxID=2636909 RepID=UPI000E342650|nr:MULTISPECIES: triphosphoribosyl-dephospho-CoA synthase MdcB [unclassified Duganella]RFP18911.1 triphosphoribosyl-dephospho-CoA synthase MdcB [Duganella sp. BJB475]RFP35574.1 triphosphoribosyl-dephospho-CoA synthase MdcB [Duganella sp. BJB476]